MSKFKRMPRSGYFVIGMVVALLLIPTVAGAGPTLRFMGIEGTSGNKADVTSVGQLQTNGQIQGTSGNHADVTNGGQLLTTLASPGNTWTSSAQFPSSGCCLLLPTPPPGEFNVLTELQVDTFIDPTPGAGGYVMVNATSGGALLADVNPGTFGETSIPFSPGQPIPYRSGGFKWSELIITIQEIGVTVTASGYFAPCSEDAAACNT